MNVLPNSLLVDKQNEPINVDGGPPQHEIWALIRNCFRNGILSNSAIGSCRDSVIVPDQSLGGSTFTDTNCDVFISEELGDVVAEKGAVSCTPSQVSLGCYVTLERQRDSKATILAEVREREA